MVLQYGREMLGIARIGVVAPPATNVQDGNG